MNKRKEDAMVHPLFYLSIYEGAASTGRRCRLHEVWGCLASAIGDIGIFKGRFGKNSTIDSEKILNCRIYF